MNFSAIALAVSVISGIFCTLSVAFSIFALFSAQRNEKYRLIAKDNESELGELAAKFVKLQNSVNSQMGKANKNSENLVNQLMMRTLGLERDAEPDYEIELEDE